MLLYKILKIIKLTIDNIKIKYYNKRVVRNKGVVKMIRTAEDCLRIREEKLKLFNKSQEEIKGQMQLIESKVMNANIDHKTKYIDIGNIGKLFSENEKQIIKDGYYITQDYKNGIRLYFDKEAYNDYINSNKKVKEAINDCNKKYGKSLNDLNDNVDSDKKSDLKKDTDEQMKDNKKGEALKFNTLGEFLDYLNKRIL